MHMHTARPHASVPALSLLADVSLTEWVFRRSQATRETSSAAAPDEEPLEDDEDAADEVGSARPIDTGVEYLRNHGFDETALNQFKQRKPLQAIAVALGGKPGTNSMDKNVALIIELAAGRSVDKAITEEGIAIAAAKVKVATPRAKKEEGPYVNTALPLPNPFVAAFLDSERTRLFDGSAVDGRKLIVGEMGLRKTALLAACVQSAVSRGSVLTALGPFSYLLWGEAACRALERLGGSITIAELQHLLPAHVRLLRFGGQSLACPDPKIQLRLAALDLKAVAPSLNSRGDNTGANNLITSKPLPPAHHPHAQRLCTLIEAAYGTVDLGQFLPLAESRLRAREMELYSCAGVKCELCPDGQKLQVNWTVEMQETVRKECASLWASNHLHLSRP